MNKVFLLGLIFWVSVIPVSALSLSTAPSSVGFSDVERGEDYSQRVFLGVDDLGENQSVNIDIKPITYGENRLFQTGRSQQNQISEQDVTEWWEIDTDINLEQATFSPENSDELYEGLIELNLQIPEDPEDAEPGLRYGHFKIQPEVETSGENQGAGLNTGRNLGFFIEINGDVQRDIVVQDVRAFRLGEDQAAVEVLLSNEGTVTTSTENFQVDVLGSGREEEASLTASGVTLAPGETQWVEASWSSGNGIEQGTYQIDGQVDYLTGSATASGSFSLPGFDVVEVRPDDSPGSDDEDRGGLPLWLVAMILVLLGVLMWSFDIEPFWILLIVGVLGISAFILMSGISNYLLALLLMTVGIVVYGGM